MMSLFSSFDLKFFYLFWISFFFLIVMLLTSFFMQTSNFIFFSAVMNNLKLFFYTLKSKSFNKFSMLMFMGLIINMFFFNFFSVFSYNFPLSSQVSLIMSFSILIWMSFMTFNLKYSLSKIFYHLVPEGAPLALSLFLFLIEMISNIIRPLTLMVRLVANITAGHLLMILLSYLIFNFYFLMPLYILLNLVELCVALIQSYIFTTMVVLYFSEV